MKELTKEELIREEQLREKAVSIFSLAEAIVTMPADNVAYFTEEATPILESGVYWRADIQTIKRVKYQSPDYLVVGVVMSNGRGFARIHRADIANKIHSELVSLRMKYPNK